MKKGFKTMLAVLALALVGSLVAGCHHRHSGHGDPEKMAEKLEQHLEHVLDKIDATEEQRGKIRQIVGQISDDARQTHKKSAEERGSIVASLLADNPDREWLHSRVDGKSKAMTEFGHRTVDRLIEISAVLTPEQRTELQKRFESAHGSKKR